MATAHHSVFIILSMIVVIVAITASYIGYFQCNLALWQRGVLLVAGLAGLHTSWVITGVGCAAALAMLGYLWSQGAMPHVGAISQTREK